MLFQGVNEPSVRGEIGRRGHDELADRTLIECHEKELDDIAVFFKTPAQVPHRVQILGVELAEVDGKCDAGEGIGEQKVEIDLRGDAPEPLGDEVETGLDGVEVIVGGVQTVIRRLGDDGHQIIDHRPSGPNQCEVPVLVEIGDHPDRGDGILAHAQRAGFVNRVDPRPHDFLDFVRRDRWRGEQKQCQ